MAYKQTYTGASPRVAIYIRVSTVHQIDKDSIAMQRRDLVAYCNLLLGTDDYVIFEDAGFSGKNTDRPEFQKMMEQIRAGGFSHLLVWKIDRISRNLLDFAAMYNELKSLNVTFVSKNEQFDTSTAMGEAMLKIILVFAELERNITSERVAATMLSRASAGLWNGGRVPYGYSYDSESKEFSINEDEARIVREMHDSYEEMRSLIRECRYLNEKGYRTRAGGLWNPVSLSHIIGSVFNCGDYRYNKYQEGDRQRPRDESEWIVVKDHHVPIISREQKDRCRKILNANQKHVRERNLYGMPGNVHVFGGIVVCGSCGRDLNCSVAVLKKSGWKFSRYSCPSKRSSTLICNEPSVTDRLVGEVVFNYILNMLNAQKAFTADTTVEDLERMLKSGSTFSYVASIERDGLMDLYRTLRSGNTNGAIYGKGITVIKHKTDDSELQSYKSQKQATERALERLQDLYLYGDDAITNSEYVVKRAQLLEKLEDINSKIGMLNADEWEKSISDEEFVRKASEFIIAQRLSNRNYVYYDKLAQSVDASALKAFVLTVLDSVTIKGGRVTGIVFKNGLAQKFILKNH